MCYPANGMKKGISRKLWKKLGYKGKFKPRRATPSPETDWWSKLSATQRQLVILNFLERRIYQRPQSGSPDARLARIRHDLPLREKPDSFFTSPDFIENLIQEARHDVKGRFWTTGQLAAIRGFEKRTVWGWFAKLEEIARELFPASVVRKKVVLSEDSKQDILDCYSVGSTMEELAERYSVDISRIAKVIPKPIREARFAQPED